MVKAQLLREQLEAQLETEAPITGEQVWARHILVETREEADAVLARLNAGEVFEDLAIELSTDTGSGAEGGDLGWFSYDRMVTPFADAAFALGIGEVSEPVESEFGFHVIKVEGHEERELEGSDLTTAQSAYVDAWYTERTTAEDVVRSWSSDMVPPAQ